MNFICYKNKLFYENSVNSFKFVCRVKRNILYIPKGAFKLPESLKKFLKLRLVCIGGHRFYILRSKSLKSAINYLDTFSYYTYGVFFECFWNSSHIDIERQYKVLFNIAQLPISSGSMDLYILNENKDEISTILSYIASIRFGYMLMPLNLDIACCYLYELSLHISENISGVGTLKRLYDFEGVSLNSDNTKKWASAFILGKVMPRNLEDTPTFMKTMRERRNSGMHPRGVPTDLEQSLPSNYCECVLDLCYNAFVLCCDNAMHSA